MGLIELNFDDTPDVLPLIGMGQRTFVIKDVKAETDKNDDPITVVELEIDEPDSDENGMKAWDRFNFKYPIARTNFKRLVKAAGLDAVGSGVDSSDLIGCSIAAIVKHRTYKDDAGEVNEAVKIAKYLFDE